MCARVVVPKRLGTTVKVVVMCTAPIEDVLEALRLEESLSIHREMPFYSVETLSLPISLILLF